MGDARIHLTNVDYLNSQRMLEHFSQRFTSQPCLKNNFSHFRTANIFPLDAKFTSKNSAGSVAAAAHQHCRSKTSWIHIDKCSLGVLWIEKTAAKLFCGIFLTTYVSSPSPSIAATLPSAYQHRTSNASSAAASQVKLSYLKH